MGKVIRYIDLFAGLGGTRIGLDRALQSSGLQGKCVFTSEIKPHAITVYQKNFPGETVHGDITKISPHEIPDFDVLLAGFPCQPFSSAGARKGFLDTRGTLFFTIEEILRIKKPKAFILENVEGLVHHDKVDKNKPIGRTLETILDHLAKLNYKVSWRVLDASEYGVPQKRKRIYIAGSLDDEVDLTLLPKTSSHLKDILEAKTDTSFDIHTPLVTKLLNKYAVDELAGKQIKDKRGGVNNIHSWDIELKGSVSSRQRALLEAILRQRRRKDWAAKKGITWSDGMPLTLDDIASFYFDIGGASPQNLRQLKRDLDDLVKKGYLSFETPKQASKNEALRGYNIVAGKLSFDISNILDPEAVTPTLVAMDVTRMAIPTENGLRRLTTREGLRLFGFPETYDISSVVYKEAFDLLGNSVSVNAIELVGQRLIAGAFLGKKTRNLPELSETTPQPVQFPFDTLLESV